MTSKENQSSAFEIRCEKFCSNLNAVLGALGLVKNLKVKRKFLNQDFCDKLDRRRKTFIKMIEHVERSSDFGLNQIIETGTARQSGNWSGDGQSTLIWDWVAREIPSIKVISVDLNPEAVTTAKAQVSHVDFHVGDSVQYLTSLDDKLLSQVSLLYLDSFDWSPEKNEASSQHHLKELLAVWDRLPSGCLIVVDDVIGADQGKHIAVERFMNEKNIQVLFKDYQIGWIKPQKK